MARRAAEEERARLQEAVGVLEGRVSSLLTDLDDTTEQVTEASQQRDTTRDEIAGLTGELDEARAEAPQLQAQQDASEAARGQAEADRDGAHIARQSADEERTRLQETVGELESKVSSLVTDLDDTAVQLRQASQQRDTAHDEIVLLTEQLRRTSAELARLQAGRDEVRSAAGRGIARAAEAARLLSETLAEVALTGGGRPELQAGTESAVERLAEGPRSRAGELVWNGPRLGDEPLERGSRPVVDPAWDEPWLIDDRLGEPQGRRGDRTGRRADEHRPGRARRGDEDRPPSTGWPEEERLPGRSRQTDEYSVNPTEVSTGPVKQPRPATRRRRPLPLPPAVFYDSFEAADHLVRVPGILLVIDGHNVSSLSSPDVELSRQRHQLVDTLMKLPKGAEPQVQVVFERADLSGWFEPPAPDRCQMRVTFAPDGEPPDQVIRDLIDQLHPAQAVVVATNDRLLQEWVRRCGGNVVSVPQVLAVLDRVSVPAGRPGSTGRFRRRKG
jgi:predicted RNA-binding protein with PIN domain